MTLKKEHWYGENITTDDALAMLNKCLDPHIVDALADKIYQHKNITRISGYCIILRMEKSPDWTAIVYGLVKNNVLYIHLDVLTRSEVIEYTIPENELYG